MPLTQDSFRDPRKQFAMRVLSGFIIEGRDPANEGDIVHVSRSIARELMHSKKAEPYDPAYDAAQTRASNTAPTPEAVVVKKAPVIAPEPDTAAADTRSARNKS